MKPRLKIIDLADITPLMEFKKEKAEYLEEIIRNSGSIRDPLSLASPNRGEYLLLDDAALLEALRRLKITSVPAQVIPLRKSLKIAGTIIAEGMKISCIDDFLNIFPRSCDVSDGNKGCCPASGTIVTICRKGEDDRVIYFKRCTSNHISPIFFDFLHYLKRSCTLTERIYPAVIKSDNLKTTTDSYLLKISNITADDLLFVARQGYLFPSGLLGFEFGSCIMGIDYPVNVLKERVPARDKEQFFHDLVNIRLRSGYSRFIRRGVYLLNY